MHQNVVGTLSLTLSVLSPFAAYALPQGGQVVAGQADIGQNGTAMTVTQASHAAIIDWQSFNVENNESVIFRQPGTSAVILNRVEGGNASRIYGQIKANGQVFLVNPNGVYFARGARVSTGGLVVSTLGISNAELLSGHYHFAGDSSASVVNKGEISARQGGVVAFIAPVVDNEGRIATPGGTTAMGAGSAVDMKIAGNSLVSFQVSKASLKAELRNGGAIIAKGGAVIMSAKAEGAVLRTVVNNTGVVDAQGVTDNGGVITLLGGTSGTVENSGTLDTSSAKGMGGTITVTGQSVQIENNARIIASGGSGGGTVNIVGGLKGGGDIPQATSTIVAAGATINASATKKGNGGTVVVRSDVANAASHTQIAGTLVADGGQAGGHGGVIETSGAMLDTTGIKLSASAPKGAAGQWLLDPTMIEITSATPASGTMTLGSSPETISGTNSSYIAPTTIESALNAGTSVTVATSGIPTEQSNGGTVDAMFDIWVLSPIAKTAGGDATLTLQAAGNVYIGAPITSTSGELTVALDAGNNGGTLTGTGAILLASDITTDGGAITFGTGGTSTNSNNVTAVSGGDVYVDSQLQSQDGGGSQTNQLVALDTSSPTGGGDVTVNGQLMIANASGFTVNSFSSGTGSSGNVYFAGTVDSGNTFQYVNTPVYWDDAYNDAKSGTGTNIGDTYLATPNTSVLNAAASFVSDYQKAWLGGERLMTSTVTGTPNYNDTTDLYNTWYWVAGPLGMVVNNTAPTATAGGVTLTGNASPTGYGTAFFIQSGSTTENGNEGNVIPGQYSNWNRADGHTEPNNNDGTGLAPSGAEEWQLQFLDAGGVWNDLGPGDSGTMGYVVETNRAPGSLTVDAGTGTITLAAGVGTISPLSSFTATGKVIQLPQNPQINTVGGTNLTSSDITVGGTKTDLLTIAAQDQTTLYAATQPTNLSLSYTLAGAGASQNLQSLPSGVSAPTQSWSVTPSSTSNIGIYTDTLSGPQTGGGCTIIYSSGTLTINPRVVTVTGESVAPIAYDGTANATLTGGSLSGVLPQDKSSVTLVEAGIYSNGGDVGTNIPVTATDSLSGSEAGNYILTQPTALTGTISQLSVTLTYNASAQSVYYGTPPSGLTGSVTGVNASGAPVSQQAIAGLGTPTWTTNATITSNIGDYEIDGSGLSSNGNITIIGAPVQAASNATAYTVTPEPLTITANPATKTYDGLAYSGGNGYTIGSTVNNDPNGVSGTAIYGIYILDYLSNHAIHVICSKLPSVHMTSSNNSLMTYQHGIILSRYVGMDILTAQNAHLLSAYKPVKLRVSTGV